MVKRSIALVLSLVLLFSLNTTSIYAVTDSCDASAVAESIPEESVPAEESVTAESTSVETAPATLYDRLMACTTARQMEQMLSAAPQSEVDALSQAQRDEIEAKYAALVPAPAPDPKPEEVPAEPPVESEIVYPAITFTNAAPFMLPVVGPQIMRAMLAAAPEKDNGVEVNKTAAPNEDGTYTINLEAYTTGDKIITEVTEDIPTDIVLVLDQSGSMAWDMETVGGWKVYEGSNRLNMNYYKHRANGGDGQLYFQRSPGEYVKVSVEKDDNISGKVEYVAYSALKTTNGEYYNASSAGNLYAKVGNEYKQVIVEKPGFFGRTYTYKYKDNNQEILTSDFSWGVPNLSGLEGGVLYHKEKVPTYIYSYTLNGVTTESGRSEGDRTMFTTEELWHNVPGDAIPRIDALKAALTDFASDVERKAMGKDGKPGTNDDVNHRIAVVGFASNSRRDYQNTELFVGSNQYGYDTLRPDGKNVEQYKHAFQEMNDPIGQTNVMASINALEAKGATCTNLGMEMAKVVLEQNPVQAGEKRSRVVIVFTDGAPTTGSGFKLAVANSAIKYSNEIKAMGKDPTTQKGGTAVYSVGIFNGADGNSAGKEPYRDLGSDEFDGNGTQKGKDACNWFMQELSSNNGKPHDPGFYLSAANADALGGIFKQIAVEVESGGATSSLDAQAVIKDIVSPQFQLLEGATADSIKLHTYKYLGGDQKDPKNWTLDDSALETGTKATISKDSVTGNDKVDITGFDYSANYVGMETVNGESTPRGYKLVITFNVTPKEGFLGGNGVPTNEKAEIYETNTSEKPVETFPVPTVDVPLKQLSVSVPDGYVYLGDSVSGVDLNNRIEVYADGIRLDLTAGKAGNWGLEPWQVAYVDITTPNASSDFVNMTEDKTLTVNVEMHPTTGQGGEKAQDTGTIRVLKPVITWQDSQIDLGDTANYEAQNFVKTQWKYNDMLNTDPNVQSNIIGNSKVAPDLTFTYTPNAGAFKVDTPVKVAVSIGKQNVTQFVTFDHQQCDFAGCKWGTAPEFRNPACQFIVHIKSFDLTITKVLNGKNNESDSFLFRIENADTGYSNTVVIHGAGSVTLKGLPSGTYTVTEDTSWSWAYTCDQASQTVTPDTVTNGTANVTFTNTAKEDVPLNSEISVDNRWTENGVIAMIKKLLSPSKVR